MIKLNTTAVVSSDDLTDAINENLSNKQKIELVKRMSEFGKMTDMSYVEMALVAIAKIGLKRIKKDRALYNRNRPYFNALKTIVRLKEAN